VFDFDRTLTTRDTSLSFLAFAAGRARLAASLVLGGPLFLMDLTAALARGSGPVAGSFRDRFELGVHDRLLRARSFRGRSAAELDELGRRFAAEALDTMVEPDALAQSHGTARGATAACS
jgi:hypothetical protein